MSCVAAEAGAQARAPPWCNLFRRNVKAKVRVTVTAHTVAYGLTGGTALCVLLGLSTWPHLKAAGKLLGTSYHSGPRAPFRPVGHSKPTRLTLRAVEGETWASTVVVRSGRWQTLRQRGF